MAGSTFWSGYTGGQTAAPAVAPAKSGGILGFLGSAVHSIVDPIAKTGENIFNVANASAAQNAEAAHIKDANSAIQNINQQEQTGKLTHDAAVTQRMNVQNALNSNDKSTKATVLKSTALNPTTAAANAADSALTLGSLGGAGILKSLAEGGVKSLAKSVASTGVKDAISSGAKQGTVLGGAYGALKPVEQGDTNLNDVGNNALLSGVEGGLGGAALGGGSSILSKVLPKKVISAATKTEASPTRLAQEANGAKSPIASSSASARQYGTNLLANKLNISSKDAQKFNAVGTIQSLQDKYGLTAEQAAKLHPVVTGGEGASTESLNGALEGIGNIDLTNFKNDLGKELNDPDFIAANGLSKSQKNNLSDVITKYHDTLNPTNNEALAGKDAAGYKIDQGVNAKNAMDAAKSLEKEGYKNTAKDDANKNATGDMQLKMADYIKRAIYNSPKGGDALQAAKEETANQLNTIAKASGNAKVGKIADDFNNAKTFEDFRNISAPFVNAKNLSDITENNNLANKGSGQGFNGAVSTALNLGSKIASPGAGKALMKYSEATAPSNAVKAPGILGRIANTTASPSSAIGTLERATLGSGIANQNAENQNAPVPQAASAVPDVSSISDQAPTTDASTSTNPFANPQVIQALVLQDIASTGGKNISEILALKSAFAPPAETSTQKTAANAAQNAGGAIDQIQQDFSAAGGGQGPLGGTLANLEGAVGLNSNAATYNQTATALAAQVYKALGNTGTISDQDQKLIQSLIPKTTDTKQTADQKITQLQTLLQQAQATASGTSSQ